MGRSSAARQSLMDSAGELIFERGYAAVGVAEICARAGVLKGSFYHFFPSKQALTVAAVDDYWTRQRACWAKLLGDQRNRALDRLRAVFAANVETQTADKRDRGVVRGCLLGNLALELSAHDPVMRARLDTVFGEQVEMVRETLVAAAAEGTLEPGRATAGTARALLAQLEGMVLFAKVANDPGVLDALWPQVLRLLGVESTVDASARA
jgi:TetR/AcrR family transcriptional regulator, transcriptional repressor for nem operon